MDVAPRTKTTPQQKIAQLVRMLGTTGGERKTTFQMLERTMEDAKVSWSDLGNWIEHGSGNLYTEAEMVEFTEAARAEWVEQGIKIGLARAHNGSGNGRLMLPTAEAMAEYCHQRLGQLKDDKQREFVSDMHVRTQRGRSLSPAQLLYLASIYNRIGGRV